MIRAFIENEIAKAQAAKLRAKANERVMWGKVVNAPTQAKKWYSDAAGYYAEEQKTLERQISKLTAEQKTINKSIRSFARQLCVVAALSILFSIAIHNFLLASH